MAVKLFLLGFPGSGKSTIARHIAEYAKNWRWSTAHFSDYPLLQAMFHNDIEGKYFNPAEGGGFDVLDAIVLDMALKELEQSVNEYMHTARPKEIVLIEFARNDHYRAFSQFKGSFLRDTYLLYLDAELDICKQRTFARAADPVTGDDHLVSDYAFETYYRDSKPILWSDLIAEFKFDRRKVKVLNNNGSLRDVTAQISDFVKSICKSS